MTTMDVDEYIDRYSLIHDTPESIARENVTDVYRDFVRRGKRAEMTEAEAFDAAEAWYNRRNAVADGVAALRAARLELLRKAGKTPDDKMVQAIRDCFPYEALFRNAY